MLDITSPEFSCNGCMACYNVCPQKCITMKIDLEGFWYPEINKEECIGCGLCESVCPEINVYINNNSTETPKAFAAIYSDDSIRVLSSSGGVFTCLSEVILNENGVVFGADFDEKLNVTHREAHDKQQLSDLRGSKYVQSKINYSFQSIKAYLEKGKIALFSGTPCQIAGLYNYLRTDYQNLYTCSVICHGVPSPKVYNAYKVYMQNVYRSKIKSINFRNKNKGWREFSIKLLFEDSQEYNNTLREDPFLLGFLRNYYLRPSCYECKYARLPRVADITMGDFWGVEKSYPEFDDKGVSLVLVNTPKGCELFNRAKVKLTTKEISLEEAKSSNINLYKPTEKPKTRDQFFYYFNNNSIESVIKKYLRPQNIIIAYLKKIKNLFMK